MALWRGVADGMAGREDEHPPPIRLAAPWTVSCRVPFLAFLIHQRFSKEEKPARGDVGLDERFYVAIELQCHDQDDVMQLSPQAEWTTRLHKKKWV